MTLAEIYQASEKHPIVFFDGVCNLCNGFVQMVIRNDVKGRIQFCALQNIEGQQIRKELGLGENLDTAIGLYQNKVYTHSDVLYMVAKSMGGWWNILYPFYFLPKALRDVIYNWVARNRYNWFGQSDQCMVPSKKIMTRFLSQ